MTIKKCIICGEEKEHYAKGMCSKCYHQRPEVKAKKKYIKKKRCATNILLLSDERKELKKEVVSKRKVNIRGGTGKKFDNKFLETVVKVCPNNADAFILDGVVLEKRLSELKEGKG